MIYLLVSCMLLTTILFLIYVYKNKELIKKPIPRLNIEKENITICEEMLKIIKNSHTKVEYNKDKKSNLNYYNHTKDVIILKSNKSDDTRIVQIAHECIHTTQAKQYLDANKHFSNLQLIYFLISLIVIICKEENELELVAIQLIMLLGTIFVKVVIEGDASYRSVDLAKRYLEVIGKESNEYIETIKELIYNTMPIYYLNFFSQGMAMIIINTIVALIM